MEKAYGLIYISVVHFILYHNIEGFSISEYHFLIGNPDQDNGETINIRKISGEMP